MQAGHSYLKAATRSNSSMQIPKRSAMAVTRFNDPTYPNQKREKMKKYLEEKRLESLV
jgi:hypothetical protein